MSRLRPYLSFSNVVACLALFVALGGTSYAAIKITGKNVKNGSLSGADIKNNSVTGSDIASLTAKDFKGGKLPASSGSGNGSNGSNGTNGVKGATGPQGPAGPRGPSGATNAVVRTQRRTLGASGSVGASVACLPGEVAIGGGIVTTGASNSGDQVGQSGPAADQGEAPTAWSLSFFYTDGRNLVGGGFRTITFSAVCARP